MVMIRKHVVWRKSQTIKWCVRLFYSYYVNTTLTVSKRHKRKPLTMSFWKWTLSSYRNFMKCWGRFIFHMLKNYLPLAFQALTLTPLTWRIWWAPNNASKWQMGFNSAFKGLKRKMPVPATVQSNAWVFGARLLGLRVRIPPEAWLYDSWEFCVLISGGLCVGPIIRPKESYRVQCV
jgi:hypothetical protein